MNRLTLFGIISLAMLGASFADEVHPSYEAELAAARQAIAKIKWGMSRAEAEAILGPNWKELVVVGWIHGQDATYTDRFLPHDRIDIRFDWTGKRGIGRTSKPEDPVIQLPVIREYLSTSDAARALIDQ